MSTRAVLETSHDPPASRVVWGLTFATDDDALLDGLRAGHASAIAAFCDRYSPHVLRVLTRILGRDPELADLHHDVFVRALDAVSGVRDAASLKGWITIVTVNVARSRIARRARQRWLQWLPWYELPDVEADARNEQDVEALQHIYAILDRLPAAERIIFTLRIIDGMELTEVAESCRTSLATVKRRLKRAEERFTKIARQDPLLVPWLKRGSRWSDTT